MLQLYITLSLRLQIPDHNEQCLFFDVISLILLSCFTASLWSWFGSPSSTEEDQSDSLLANQSLLLLLVLVNHCTQDKKILNPYRLSLFTFTDSKGMECCIFHLLRNEKEWKMFSLTPLEPGSQDISHMIVF